MGPRNGRRNGWDDDAPTRGEKGKSFRGGSKAQRDNWYGYNDKNFQRWWHREGKREFGGNDIDNKSEADVAYKRWVELGKPKRD